MPRDLSEAVLAQLVAGHMRPLFLADIEFTSETAHVWSGMGTVVWEGKSYVGLGHLASISSVTEQNEVQAQNITISMSAIPAHLLEEAINECRQNGQVKVWFGVMLDDGTIVADPSQIFLGRLDVPTVQEGADASTISITVENPLVDLQRPAARRFTPEDQKIDYPEDLGFDQVPALQTWNGKWGKA